MAEKLKIAFAGDVSVSGKLRERVLAGEEMFDETILQTLGKQDFVVVNLEGPTTNLPAQKTTGIALSSPPELIPYLIERNIKVFNLANNHLFDSGLEGFNETISLIEVHGGYWFGAGLNLEEALRPLELRAHGIARGLMGMAHNEGMVTSPNGAGVLCETSGLAINVALQQYQKSGKQVIINYHGGEEYTRYPSPLRRSKLQKMAINANAWVVAHHAHTLQGVETIKGHSVFYSLGNFMFSLDAHNHRAYVNQSAILLAEFDAEGGTYNWLPIQINAEKGRVEARSQGPFETEMASLSDWENYESHWLQEAHRVFWMTRSGGPPTTGTSSSHRSASVLGKVFKPSAWLALWRMYANQHTRPIVLGALRYKMKRKGGPA